MADKIEIQVSISPDGRVTLSTHGLKGSTCLAETEAVEQALGKVVRREKTPEAYQQGTRTAVKGRAK